MASEEWKNNLRMSKEDFENLVELIRPHVKERSSQVRQDVINVEKRVAVTLYYLKDQGSMKMTASTFGIARCTVGQIVHEICGILTNNLGPDLIKFPTEKNKVLEASSQFLEKFGFPQVIGCIDGTHIPIKQPTENSRDYFSYKMTYSINCQAICNAFGQFLDVEIKLPGSVHDAHVFANCGIQRSYSEGKLNLFHKELLPGHECVPQILLADPAYPLLPYVVKEFGHCTSNEQVVFNEMLRSARN